MSLYVLKLQQMATDEHFINSSTISAAHLTVQQFLFLFSGFLFPDGFIKSLSNSRTLKLFNCGKDYMMQMKYYLANGY